MILFIYNKKNWSDYNDNIYVSDDFMDNYRRGSDITLY